MTLGTGVAMLLTADLGSDGFSTLVNGVSISVDTPFVLANAGVSVAFLLLAAVRGLRPGVGTLVQVVLVGSIVSLLMPVMDVPGSLVGQVLLLTASLPVLALGIASYLGSHLGAGPAESAALAWDPPVPFRWSYSAVQLTGAVLGAPARAPRSAPGPWRSSSCSARSWIWPAACCGSTFGSRARPDGPAHQRVGGVWGGVVRVRRSGGGSRGRGGVVRGRG